MTCHSGGRPRAPSPGACAPAPVPPDRRADAALGPTASPMAEARSSGAGLTARGAGSGAGLLWVCGPHTAPASAQARALTPGSLGHEEMGLRLCSPHRPLPSEPHLWGPVRGQTRSGEPWPATGKGMKKRPGGFNMSSAPKRVWAWRGVGRGEMASWPAEPGSWGGGWSWL